ncbi:interleukin-12 subunit beta [Neolamprologus brichardi]|nr:interleukin-12 subunit beta [Neolamprologus brichardi]
MHTFLLMVVWAILSGASADTQQTDVETLMDNVVVLRVPSFTGSMVHVPLTCGEAFQNEPVFWKKNGQELNPPLQGNQVQVLVEEMKGGNYTCHLSPSGEYLNHTMILIQLNPDNRTVILENREGGHIHCSAPNYTGFFHCSWKRTALRSDASVVLVKAERFTEDIPCELDADASGVRCQDAHCPYKEEQHHISFTVYIRSHARLEAYTKSFYLREIVRPSKLPNLHISDGKVFSWDYPDTWEKPCAYFGLQFEVKLVHSGHPCNSDNQIINITTDTTKYEVGVKTKKYVFCVRAQDKFTRGPWSHWSQCTVNKHNVAC